MTKQSISPEQGDLPAVHVNRFTVVYGDLTRITFLEQIPWGDKDGKAIPRTAVVMLGTDALELAKLIIGLDEQLKAKKEPRQ